MLSYDDQYLYLAGYVPRDPGVVADGVQYAGRTHDADLHQFDRITVAFDVDRDYSSWYRFEIDQRGWTREALWDDERWNPDWFVAAAAEGSEWRVEAAIPWQALVPSAPQRGTIWAAGLSRVIPAVGLESWTHPATLDPRGETFGLVQFD
jgi:hypothetical protein